MMLKLLVVRCLVKCVFCSSVKNKFSHNWCGNFWNRGTKFRMSAMLLIEILPGRAEVERGNKQKRLNIAVKSFIVGVPRFELGTPCSQSRCANRTALHPEDICFLKCSAKVGRFYVTAKFFGNFFRKKMKKVDI